MKVIGITGTIGAGKGTIVDYLMNNKGFVHFSVRGYLSQEILRRGMMLNRDSMVQVANELRSTHSPAFIIQELYSEAISCGSDCVIESLRATGEVDALRNVDHFRLLAVDADPRLRYERIVKRGSETDKIDFKTFLANEEREMTSEDPTKQNLKRCISMADKVLWNNGTITELYAGLEEWLSSEL